MFAFLRFFLLASLAISKARFVDTGVPACCSWSCPYLASNLSNRSLHPLRFASGSHVASSYRYDFQCTRYSVFPPFVTRFANMPSTSYVLSSEDTAGSGCRLSPCLFTSEAGSSRFAWKIGNRCDASGSFSRKLTGEVCCSTSKGP